MKNLKLYISLLVIFVVLTFACKKKEEQLSPEPEIELISVTPTEMVQFESGVTVILKYKDNNGDLGFEDPDELSLSAKDSRLEVADWYHIPPLSPPDHELKIEGELKVELKKLFLLGNGSQEITTFTIKIKDREGNWSNEIITPAITVRDSL